MIDPPMMNGLASTTAMSVLTYTVPRNTELSPQHAARSVDFPLPTKPVTATISEGRTLREAARRAQ